MHPNPHPIQQLTKVVHTPAIAYCMLNTPESRVQPTFARTTPLQTPVHVCAHTSSKPNNQADLQAGSTQ